MGRKIIIDGHTIDISAYGGISTLNPNLSEEDNIREHFKRCSEIDKIENKMLHGNHYKKGSL